MRKKAAKLRKMNFFKKKCLNYLQIQKLFCIFVALFVGRNISQRFGWGGKALCKASKNNDKYVQLYTICTITTKKNVQLYNIYNKVWKTRIAR